MRENLIKEKHSGGLARHFGRDKTLALVSENYYWPQLQQDVKKFVQQLQSMSDGERSEAEYRVVSAITYTREALGGYQYGLCSWFTKDTMGT